MSERPHTYSYTQFMSDAVSFQGNPIVTGEWEDYKQWQMWVSLNQIQIFNIKQPSFSFLSPFRSPLTFIHIHTKSNTHLWCERQLHASSSCAWLGAEGTCPIRPIHTMSLHSHKPCDLPWPLWGSTPSPWPSVHTSSALQTAYPIMKRTGKLEPSA